jgi:hypothetical protein
MLCCLTQKIEIVMWLVKLFLKISERLKIETESGKKQNMYVGCSRLNDRWDSCGGVDEKKRKEATITEGLSPPLWMIERGGGDDGDMKSERRQRWRRWKDPRKPF